LAPSFTSQSPDLLGDGPIVDLSLAVSGPLEAALLEAGEAVPPPIRITGLIDTGAARSVIAAGLVEELGLRPVGTTRISTPSSADVPCYTYRLRLLFPNLAVQEVTVIEAPLRHGLTFDCLIARDVLAHGILIYLGTANSFTLSF
jgi:hypothetical protein